jgi:hypothetical protein
MFFHEDSKSSCWRFLSSCWPCLERPAASWSQVSWQRRNASYLMDIFFFLFLLFDLFFYLKFWMMSGNGQIRRDPLCFDYNSKRNDVDDSSRVYMYYCREEGEIPHQKWSFENSLIKHVDSGLCLEMNKANHKLLNMRICNSTYNYQKWIWPSRAPKLVQKSNSLIS